MWYLTALDVKKPYADDVSIRHGYAFGSVNFHTVCIVWQ